MAAMNDVYVDPSIDGNSGAGTSGDMYGDLQWALDQVTRNAEGDMFHVKSGTAEVLTAPLDLSTYLSAGDVTIDQPFGIRGFTTSIWDGGQAEIEGATNSIATMFASSGHDFTSIADLHIRGFTTHGLSLDNNCVIFRNRFTDNAESLTCDAFNEIVGNEFHCGTNLRDVEIDASICAYNWLISAAADTLTDMLFLSSFNNRVFRNIFTLTGANAANAINVSLSGNFIDGNTIDGGGASPTGAGIIFDAATHVGCVIRNNIIANFDGAGGAAIDFGASTVPMLFYGNNAFWNNTDHVINSGDEAKFNNPSTSPDNEALGSDPYARSGANTFANRFTYWAPNNVGNVRGGAYPSGSLLDKGAVQSVSAGGGGLLVHPGTSGGARG